MEGQMSICLRRREFVAGLGGAVAAWPLAARAQRRDRVRRIGVLMPFDENNPGFKSDFSAFTQALADLGWTDGRNLRMDLRWAAGNTDRIRAYVAELLSLQPDVVLITGARVLAAMQEATRIVPLVFVGTVDPVAQGFVASWARPGGNTTGFTAFEFSLIGKMLQALKQIAPQIARVAFIFHPDSPEPVFFMKVLETVAPSFAVTPIAAPVGDRAEIERAIENLARDPNTGLLVPPDVFLGIHAKLIVQLATLHRLPAAYSNGGFPRVGGLISYGIDSADLYRRAAGYIDRILKGAKPADLPVQAPTKFELVINLKAANALGFTIPPTLLAVADEVIE
jgi:putative ABC transport system substrate-binding protein